LPLAVTKRHRYQLFGRNYQDRERPRAHLESIAKGNPARPERKDAMFKTPIALAVAIAITLAAVAVTAINTVSRARWLFRTPSAHRWFDAGDDGACDSDCDRCGVRVVSSAGIW
jgi:hypothetical protein